MAHKKILVIDDAEFNRDLLVQLLTDEYQVIVAADGEQGLQKAAQEQPDLILLDLGLPGLSGWEASRRFKTDNALKHIPIIAVTSHAMVGDEARARAAGCDDYLAKPIDENELLAKIRKYI
ncbi:MAG: response regulator [Betaproteobacteria bacterium]|nr:response regulator [Betaproteobacteria bacterium]